MAVEKLKNVKLFNAISLNNEANFFYHEGKVDIYLDGIILTLIDKRTKDTICTTLMNVVCFAKQPVPTVAGEDDKKVLKK